MDVNEIIQSVTEEDQEVDIEVEDGVPIEPEKVPKASEAFTCFDTVLKWMKQQPE